MIIVDGSVKKRKRIGFTHDLLKFFFSMNIISWQGARRDVSKQIARC